MGFPVVWSEPAIENLGDIVRYVARENPAAAETLGMELIEHMALAANFPKIGPLFAEARDGEYRCLTHGRYRLYYRLKPALAVIEVVAVRHTASAAPSF